MAASLQTSVATPKTTISSRSRRSTMVAGLWTRRASSSRRISRGLDEPGAEPAERDVQKQAAGQRC